MNAALQVALLIATPGVPLALAFAAWIWPSFGRHGELGIAAALPAIAASGLLSPGTSQSLPWLLAGSELGIDSIGRIFLLASSLLWAASAGWAAATIRGGDRERAAFHGFLLLSMCGNLGLIVARDMLVFYLCFTLMSLAAYGMIVHSREPAARGAGRVYVSLVIAGDLMLYAALAIIALAADGELTFGAARAALAVMPGRDIAMTLLVLGFGVKIGLIGLHVSLPLIYAAAPTAAAAALAGPVINAGLLGWLRLLPLGAAGLETWGTVLIVAGSAAAFYGALVGITQRNAGAVLAYSSISQMGVMTLGIGFALRVPAAAAGVIAAVTIYALHHAFTKSALFFGGGIARRSPSGRFWRPLVYIGLALPALALAGAPLTGGMLAKASLKASLTEHGGGMLASLLPWTAVATTAVTARFLYLVWPRGRAGGAAPAPLASAGWLVALAGAAAAAWLVPAAPRPDTAMLWSGAWPVLLGTAAALGAARLLTAPAVPNGDVLVLLLVPVHAARRAFDALARGMLPRARDGLLRGTDALRRDPRWPRWLDRAERRLAAWPVASALVVTLILVLAAVGAL